MQKVPNKMTYYKSILLVFLILVSGLVKAQLTVTNSTYLGKDPDGSSTSFSHTQSAGTDLYMYVIIQMKNQSNTFPTAVSFNGDAFTRKITGTNSFYNYSVWERKNPDVGTHSVNITYNKGSYGKQGMTVISFENCDGIGTNNIGSGGSGIRTATLIAQTNSKIVAFGNSGGSPPPTLFKVPNPTNASILWSGKNGNGKRYFGGISDAVVAGSNTFAVQVATNNSGGKKVYPIAFEVKEFGALLPIELVSFDAVVNNDAVNIEWQTAMELNNDFFTVERSRDLTYFEVLDTISGAGNSNTHLFYSYDDINPLEGVSYYRLKQTDYNGDFDYSLIRSVTTSPVNRELYLYPNPTTGLIYIEGTTNSSSTLRVDNIFGENVSQTILKTNISENKISLDLSSLKNGIYFLKIDDVVFRLVKR